MAKEMLDCLTRLQEKVTVAVVGGSDRNKQIEQLGEEGSKSRRAAYAPTHPPPLQPTNYRIL